MENKEALDTLKDIRDMMERSSKCLSLSGLSGVFIGIYAIIGAVVVKYLIGNPYHLDECERNLSIGGIAVLVLVLAVLTAAILSERKARKTGQSIFNRTARLMHSSILTVLLPGGVLCISMACNGFTQFITSVMLVFYGLSLVSASRYTFKDILYLGYCMLGLGMINCFFTSYSLVLWTIGFGFFHIIYGILMYFKYERANE